MQSTEIDKLATALAAAQAEMMPAIKDSTNPHFKSQYADLQSIWAAARPVLHKHGLSVVQTFEANDGTMVAMTSTLLHTSGQFIGGTLVMKPTKSDPQGIGSAATYARRYGLAALIGIVADEDDDGNAASRNGSGREERTPPMRTPPPRQDSPGPRQGAAPQGEAPKPRPSAIPPPPAATPPGGGGGFSEPKVTAEQLSQLASLVSNSVAGPIITKGLAHFKAADTSALTMVQAAKILHRCEEECEAAGV